MCNRFLKIIALMLFGILFCVTNSLDLNARTYSWSLDIACDNDINFKFNNETFTSGKLQTSNNGNKIDLEQKNTSLQQGEFIGELSIALDPSWNSFAKFERFYVWLKYKVSFEQVSGWGYLDHELDCSLNGSRELIKKIPDTSKRSSDLNSSSSTLKNETDYNICYQALYTNEPKWDERNPYFKLRVLEAKSRGLSEEDCARILGRSKVRRNRDINKADLSGETDREICQDAVVFDNEQWKWDTSNSYFRNYVEEAKHRNISLEKCVEFWGERIDSEKGSATTQGSEADNRTVCYMAYDSRLNTWDHSANSARYVTEAKTRGFSSRDCADILRGRALSVSKTPQKVLEILDFWDANKDFILSQ